MARTVLSTLEGLMYVLRCLRLIILDVSDPPIQY